MKRHNALALAAGLGLCACGPEYEVNPEPELELWAIIVVVLMIIVNFGLIGWVCYDINKRGEDWGKMFVAGLCCTGFAPFLYYLILVRPELEKKVVSEPPPLPPNNPHYSEYEQTN